MCVIYRMLIIVCNTITMCVVNRCPIILWVSMCIIMCLIMCRIILCIARVACITIVVCIIMLARYCGVVNCVNIMMMCAV